ncbi:MAG: Htaa domain-containing protein, partial [Actinomycetales bacterium]
TTTGQASYATPSFAFSAGAGAYDGAKAAGRLAWTGGIEFTGHDGALDTTVSDPVLRMTDAKTATLLLDVTGVSMDDAMAGKADEVERKDVPFVTLDLSEADVRTEDSKVVYSAVPTALTTQGQAAFPNYEAGTAFDPIDLSFSTEADCAAAAGSPSGSDPSAAAGSADVQQAAASTDGGQDWVPWVGGGVIGALLVLVGGGGFLLGRRATGGAA